MIYIVSGFFRSGTSMMMQALEAGGIAPYFSRERNAVNEHFTDARSRPNPMGLYEPSMADLGMIGFPRQHHGKAVKILIPWMQSMAVHRYRVVVMQHDPRAIMDSYERAFREFWDAARRAQWIAEYPERLALAVRQFYNRRDVLTVNLLTLTDVLRDPRAELNKLVDVGWPIDVEGAVAVIDPAISEQQERAWQSA